MSEAVWKNCKFYAGAYDFSGNMNALGLDYSAETPERTAMGDTGKTRLPGLLDVGFSLNGNVQHPDPDLWLFNNMSLADTPITMAETGADQGPAFLFQPILAQYTPGAKIGEVMAFSVKGSGDGKLISGSILYPKTIKTASDTGVIRQLSAVSATQTLYAILHVFAVSAGDTLDVIIQSDALEAFGSPETKITFAQKSAIGSEYKTAAGEITDTWYRVSFTIGGADPSFTFAVSIGIL